MSRRRFFRSELDREIILLAWPVIISNLLQTITMFIDMLMVGQLGAEALAAVGLGAQVLFFVWAIVMGLSTGTIAIIARRHGEGEAKVQIGPRIFKKKDGGELQRRAGRLTIEDLIWFYDIIDEVKDELSRLTAPV